MILPLDAEAANDPMLIEAFPDQLRLIGLIVAAWSEVEYKLASLFALRLHVPMAVASGIIYAIESSGARLEMLRSAFLQVELPETERSEALAILEEAKSLLAQRNKYAHSLYGDNGRGTMTIIGVRRDTAVDLPLHDLAYQFDRMKNLSFRVGRLIALQLQVFQEKSTEQEREEVLKQIQSIAPDSRMHPE